METTPTRCRHCGEPFRILDKRVVAWRSSDGQFYCNEFCAEALDEGYIPRRKLAS